MVPKRHSSGTPGGIMRKTMFKALLILSCIGLSLSAAAAAGPSSSDLAVKMTALDTQVRVLSEKLRAEKAKSSVPATAASAQLLKTSPALLQLQILNPDLASAVAKDCGSEGPIQPPPEEPTQSCVPNCTFRLSNGSCASYGSDFCAHEASCSENCTFRLSNGSCASYAPDYCGSDTSCSPNCTFRLSDGSCASYGPDVCS